MRGENTDFRENLKKKAMHLWLLRKFTEQQLERWKKQEVINKEQGKLK